MAYVELEKARELLFKFRNECIDFGVKEDTVRGILYSINELTKLPTADVVEVKHGYWEVREDSYFCSECGSENCYAFCESTKRFTDIYCPQCGALMDGGKIE